MRFDQIAVPDSAAATAAREVSAEYHSPALLNHCQRSYAFAVGFAVRAGLAYDAELLYVSAMLHDIGLTSAFDNHRLAFEKAGGHVAWVLTAGAGWPVARRRRALEVIERHMWPAVDPEQDPEGHLLEIATGLDISGARPDVLPRPLIAEVLARFPRLDLAAEFTVCLTDQAARKSDTAAARLVTAGLAARLRNHPLEEANSVNDIAG